VPAPAPEPDTAPDLLQWSVPVGKGAIVATGLNLFGKNATAAAPFPEQAWVLDRLVRYAASLLISKNDSN
jgi:hypothetical protein